MPVKNMLADMAEEITEWRRTLHQNPQTGFDVQFAHDFIVGKLREWGVSYEDGWAKTGIVATIPGRSDRSGRAIALRADMDALDMEEVEGREWRSQNPGKMHACGHDGHMAMLLGAIKYMHENNNFDGTVHCIFQPAEEGDGGALVMLDEGLFEKHPVESVYGMHNWPGLPKGEIAVHNGPVMASVDEFEITVKGQGGHAAMPHLTRDPVTAAAQIVANVNQFLARRIDPMDQVVISFTNFNAGTGAFNVIADAAFLNGTVRCFNSETRAMVQEEFQNIVHNTARSFGMSADVTYTRLLEPTVNNPDRASFCAQVAEDIAGPGSVHRDMKPSMVGEDFGAMLLAKPGCYIWMGQGEADDPESPHNQGLHMTGYDFNDDILPMGAGYWVELVEKALPYMAQTDKAA